ncbi:hypothetical protein [Pseudomonas japonica]|uniref:hypothetical protein n=1 Tax=Pseudomonas japonica TaxID=256466 RepID=UPI0015E3E749|nr:hypothetical protein [Pseudomonas japonica]MBA1245797.1 hypothetical protein [Pseudomonas japonica]
MPKLLVDRCQALLDDVQQAATASRVLMCAQRALGFTEALQLQHAEREACIARLHALLEQAVSERLAELEGWK